MKKWLSFALTLAMCLGLLATTVSAAQESDLSVSFETAVFSISEETFVRMLPEPASLGECGKDEYVTVCAVISNLTGAAVTLHKPCIRVDGGEELYWNDFTLEAGGTVRLHVRHIYAACLTPGLHTAALYMSGELLASGRFGIGRDWSKIFRLPTREEIVARPADERSPYMATWLSVDGDVRYDAYSVDFKSDYLPYGTYSCVFNGFMDYSGLEEQYESAGTGGISLYGGLQLAQERKTGNSILSLWDIHCTDKDGAVTSIHADCTYAAENTEATPFDHEGEGIYVQPPYYWQAGRWYRMLLQCGTSEATGNTTVEQWFQDLTTGEWTHMCTFDVGIKNSCFIGGIALFSESFQNPYAGDVRSLEFTNVRIHTGEGWRDVVSTAGGIVLQQDDGVHNSAYGSWEAGADGSTFYMITTGVSGWGRTEGTGALTIQNRESIAPPELPVTEPAMVPDPGRFADVPGDSYCARPVAWAVEKGITTGTSETTFSPNQDCTVAQILTFLWRANGSPRPTGSNPFADVKSGDYYADAAVWAYEQGMIPGGTLSGNTPCTRAMAVTYMWNAAGSPSAKATGFTDVSPESAYADAVAWAVERGVTFGTSATAFSPDNVCTRGQIVTFLYRWLAEEQI